MGWAGVVRGELCGPRAAAPVIDIEGEQLPAVAGASLPAMRSAQMVQTENVQTDRVQPDSVQTGRDHAHRQGSDNGCLKLTTVV